MKALEKAGLRGCGYDEKVAYLIKVGLYEDDWGGRPYCYGSGWLKFDIPQDDTKRIAEVVERLRTLPKPLSAAKYYMRECLGVKS